MFIMQIYFYVVVFLALVFVEPTFIQRGARNSLTVMEVCAYARGELQYPQIHQGLICVRGIMKPPNMKMMRSAKLPPVLATTIVRHSPAMARNIADDIWWVINNTRYAPKNLHLYTHTHIYIFKNPIIYCELKSF